MSFVLLLLLTLSTFVRVKSEQSAAQMEQVQARQNAYLGLQLALGQLQKETGPDMRATATAGLTDDPADGRRHWTGVWVGPLAGETGDPIPPRPVVDGEPYRRYQPPLFRGWMVSGLDAPPDVSNASEEAALSDPVLLVGPGTVASTRNYVEAGRVALNPASDGGGVAYWVADEGVKARVNLAEEASRDRQAFALSPRFGIELLRDTEDTTLDTWLDPLNSTTLDRLSRVVSSRGWPLVAPDPFGMENAARLGRERFHDLSFHSRGLLADSYRGGLRKDLSLAFEMDLADFNESPLFASSGSEFDGDPGLTGQGYGPGNELSHRLAFPIRLREFGVGLPGNQRTWSGALPEDDPAGDPATIYSASWHLLRNFYRTYKPVDPDRSFTDYHGNANHGLRTGGAVPIIRSHTTLPLVNRSKSHPRQKRSTGFFSRSGRSLHGEHRLEYAGRK